MMIDKEVYRGMSPRDSLIMKMARNEVEIDEVIEAREFLDALKKAREDGYKGSDKDFAKEYYRDALQDGGKPGKPFDPTPVHPDNINPIKKIINNLILIL